MSNSIKDRRDYFGFSQRELAKKIGVSHAGMNFIETGKRVPNVYIAIRIAKALDSPVEELFFEDDEEYQLEGKHYE